MVSNIFQIFLTVNLPASEPTIFQYDYIHKLWVIGQKNIHSHEYMHKAFDWLCPKWNGNSTNGIITICKQQASQISVAILTLTSFFLNHNWRVVAM